MPVCVSIRGTLSQFNLIKRTARVRRVGRTAVGLRANYPPIPHGMSVPDARYRLATRTSPRDGRLSAPPRGAHRTSSNHGDMRRDLALIAWTASAAGIRPQSTRACTSAHPAPSASSSISTCAPMEAPRRTQSRNKMQEDSHWMLSHPIRGHQRPSEAIRGHQRPSKAIRGHQRPSEAIRGHQRPS